MPYGVICPAPLGIRLRSIDGISPVEEGDIRVIPTDHRGTRSSRKSAESWIRKRGFRRRKSSSSKINY